MSEHEHNTVVATDVAAEEPDMTTKPVDIDLKVSDRCDRCGAQAFVVTMHDGRPLLWCAHHYASECKRENSTLQQHMVIDARGEINREASVSAY